MFQIGIVSDQTKKRIKEDVEVKFICVDKKKGFFIPKSPHGLVILRQDILALQGFNSKEQYNKYIKQLEEGE